MDCMSFKGCCARCAPGFFCLLLQVVTTKHNQTMKKQLLMLVALLGMACAFSGCSKNDEPTSVYTERQQKVFALFSGTWADYQFSKLGGGVFEPDYIVFGQHFSKPIKKTEKSYMDGEVELYEAQGECVYRDYNHSSKSYDETPCYYYVNGRADYLALYEKATNRRFKGFDMHVNSETSIRLHDKNLSLPYVFQKQ